MPQVDSTTDCEGWIYATKPSRLDVPRLGGRASKRLNDRVRRRKWCLVALGSVEAVQDMGSAANAESAMESLWKALAEVIGRRPISEMPVDPTAILRRSQNDVERYQQLCERLLPWEDVPVLVEMLVAALYSRGAYGFTGRRGLFDSLTQGAMVFSIHRAMFDFAEHVDDASNDLAFRDMMGLNVEDVVKTQWKGSALQPVYVVARDHDLHWIVVAVRGTLSQNDILTDCAVSSVPFLGGEGVFPWTWWPRGKMSMCLPWRQRAWCLFWLLLGIQGSTTRSQGNEICFSPHANWQNLHLTYEECCSEDALQGPDCFGSLGGFYTWSFCCEKPAADSCDWHEILMVASASEEVRPDILDRLFTYPVMLREFCCTVPGIHPCWHLYTFEAALVERPFVQCCFPVLRHLLERETEADWIRTELDREFASLDRKWTSQELQDFQASIPTTPTLGTKPALLQGHTKPCLLSVRHGDLFHHGLDECCPKHRKDLEGNDCSYIYAVASALFILGAVNPLPNMDLLVSPGNQDRIEATVPVFTRHRPRHRPGGGHILLPMEWQLSPGQSRKQSVAAIRGGHSEVTSRRKGIFWRGTTSNCFMSCSISKVSNGEEAWSQCLQDYDCETSLSFSNFLNTPRGRLVLASQFLDNLDARFVGISNPVTEEFWDFLVESNLTDGRVSQLHETEWSYSINLDGTGSGDRIYWQMLMKKVVLVQQSAWVSWLLGPVGSGENAALLPWEHYVPVRMDLADMSHQMRWLDEHPEEAEKMGEQAARWTREFLSYDWILYFLDCAVRSSMLRINVVLPNGHAEALALRPSSTVQDVRTKAQQALRKKHLRLITAKNRVLVEFEQTLEEAGIEDGECLTALVLQPQLAATGAAFALCCHGDSAMVTWGNAICGGDSSEVRDQLKGVQQIQATVLGAFAAILEDGSVVAKIVPPLLTCGRRFSSSLTAMLDAISNFIWPEASVEVELSNIQGEVSRLQLPASMSCMEARKRIVKHLGSKKGAKLILHVTSTGRPLRFHQTLEEEDLVDGRLSLSYVYVATNLYDAWRFLEGYEVPEKEFALEGVTEVCLSCGECLNHLPESLETISFSDTFNPKFCNVSWPDNLQRLTFGPQFNQSLQNLDLPSGLQHLTFGEQFDKSLWRVTLPCDLQSLTFGKNFDQCLDYVKLPGNLQSLTFGQNFDQDIENVTLPSSLVNLTFGCSFNQSLEHVKLPENLQRLTFGRAFNRTLHNTLLPSKLQHLSFGDGFDHSLHKVTLPRNLQSLTFGLLFDQSLEHVTLPDNLQSLTFGKNFKQRLEHVTFPTKLQSLTFGQDFDSSLEQVNFPSNLERLMFGTCFNQSLEHVTFPDSLLSLTFGQRFNCSLTNVQLPGNLQRFALGTSFDQSLEEVQLPEKLQRLTLGHCFNQSLEYVLLPQNLQSLIFGSEFDQSLEDVILPRSLRNLTFGRNFDQSLHNVILPEDLESLTFGEDFDRSLKHVTLPGNLKSLTFGQNFNHSLDGVTLPSSLVNLTFGWRFNQSLENVKLPENLQRLTFGDRFHENLKIVALPRNLQCLTVGNMICLKGVALPSTLNTFRLGCRLVSCA
eukprot:symbB.v1.2.017070.t1/scaffold1283.1/size126978/9